MNELIPNKVKVIPTDSGASNIAPDFPVEVIPHHEALDKYKPRVVIFSWMPAGEDFTADFRSVPSVDEYILIGEPDGGVSGDEWETWGIPDVWDEEDEEYYKNKPAPYEADGFEIEHLDDLSALQLSSLNVREGSTRTQTVSFRRRKILNFPLDKSTKLL